ncbi:MAG TPA: hypothetical protein VKT52_06800, partial [Ktedonobacterales bacterium]|nr:hypothetical protein [Ktedonobacterales bacterium]
MSSSSISTIEGVQITGAASPASARILTPDALSFVAKLERTFRDTRADLLRRRIERQRELDAGKMPDFLP